MADGKFYWLKLKKDFFKRHDIKIIESMPNGKDYVLFYLKLLCESVDHDGNLRFNESIPYNEQMLSIITNTNVDIVRNAIVAFTQLELMELLDDGTYYMNKVEEMIGSAANNDNANRQRRFRERQKELALQDRYGDVTKRNESKSIEKEKETDIDIELERESNTPAPDKKRKVYGSMRNVLLTDTEYNILKDQIPDADKYIEEYSIKKASKDYKIANDYATILKWEKEDRAARYAQQKERNRKDFHTENREYDWADLEKKLCGLS